jgi:hypothetical protein
MHESEVQVARLGKIVNIWRMLFFTYNNIPPPNSIFNMFRNWFNGVNKHDKARIRIGVLALC